jgi:hypothetical protein
MDDPAENSDKRVEALIDALVHELKIAVPWPYCCVECPRSKNVKSRKLECDATDCEREGFFSNWHQEEIMDLLKSKICIHCGTTELPCYCRNDD